MKAKDIIEKLSSDTAWLHKILPHQKITLIKKETEVPVFLHTGRYGQGGEVFKRWRMDMIMTINIQNAVKRTKRKPKRVKVGIEIKTSTVDLKCDKKMINYLNFVDVFCLAVPFYMVEEAREYLKKDQRFSKTHILQVMPFLPYVNPVVCEHNRVDNHPARTVKLEKVEMPQV